MEDIGGKVLGVADLSGRFWESLRGVSSPFLILDILIVAVLFYGAYLFLHQTRAMRMLYGIFFLIALALIGKLFDLILLNWILKYLATMLVVAIPVVFQPELRTALERLGRTKFLGDFGFIKNDSNVVDDVVAAASDLSKQKTGALIVIQRATGLREYIERGTALDAKVSKGLLQSIFINRSPLHDGAVIIAGDRILSARSVLPVSEQYLSSTLGTRHKAGVGITENSDALSIIVSEETGAISLAVGGKIERRIPEDRLKNRLSTLLRQGKGGA